MSRRERDKRRRPAECAACPGPGKNHAQAAGDREPYPRELNSKPWNAILVGLMAWSAVVWLGYISVDGILDWLAANSGYVADSSKIVATAAGVGKEASAVFDRINLPGLLVQAVAFLEMLLKPVIVAFWAIGAFIIIVAPSILSKIVRLSAMRRY